jgi:hypothetical protein
MNKIARKLVLSVLTVVLTVIALGTTTFAWFTLTNTSVVQPFQAQIVSDTGIEIALDNPLATLPSELNWVTTLTTTALNDYISAAYGGNFKFNHVTTANGVTFETLGVSSLTPATGGWLEIPLHFRSNTAEQIQWSAVTLTSTAANWPTDVTFTYVDNVVYNPAQPISIDASDAMRIAIIGDLDLQPGNVVAYEKPASSVNIVLSTGGDLSDGVGVGLGDAGAMNYYYRKNNTLPFGAAAVTTLLTTTSLSSNPILDMGDGVAAEAGAAYYGEIMIRIWLEGWDANSFNSVLNRVISASFTFVGV